MGSTEQKMIEYKRLADVNNEIELDSIVSEWKDRFSRIPEEVENLIKLIDRGGNGFLNEVPHPFHIFFRILLDGGDVVSSRHDPNLLVPLFFGRE